MVLLMKAMHSKTKYFTHKMSSCIILYLVLPFFILCSFSLRCNALQSDINCLKSIKDSLVDPLGYLNSTWNFDNQTEGFICKFTGVDCWHLDENRVLGISLPDMGLKGEFPRGVQNCSTLTSLDLSNNKLHGSIPWDISNVIRFVVNFDLSSNQLSGEIPVDIANCFLLNNLRLDNNNLEGSIPPEIGSLHRLKTFSVANNMLTGQVPNFTDADVSAASYVNNPGLCGGPLEACVIERASNSRILFVCGFVTGWSLFTLLGIYLFFFGLLCVKEMLLFIKKRTKVMVIDGSEWRGGEEVKNDPKLEKIVTRMSFMELSKATSNFSQDNEIGNGMLGKVYKAQVPNGWTVAIKRLQSSENLEEEFVSEITTLGRLRHPNLVPLIGFCSERDERLLVYKYMPNGNLHDWLHSTDDKARLLDFSLRVKIVVGIAKALAWLHDGGKFHVVHGNISTQCILLDENFDPKLSNFWEATLPKTNDINSNLPIVESLDFTTYKKDVYRFGDVVLELLTRKESYQLSCLTLNFSSSSFANPLDVDKLLLGQGYDAMVMQLLELASNCMKFIPDQRPTMQQVYQTVAMIAQVDDQIGDPEIQLHED
ncbi:probably inactive leucine-rich repeat receptor-like protein kinase At5g48380 [Lycium ferocissimum]|uniref:probably inactive leucine-rich repeat receptor-like protein kinase At5g48380 n=1 Tax=Lycium ferocissimum TaxID=112874 RepID=UPI0028159112|nr:probably inactive leucine-rich repeat receptor-like protein kinase At5g48380 [Lycium ferocissimum]